MNVFAKIRDWIWSPQPDDPHEAIAYLLLAAKEDAAFRARLLALLRAPALQRESLVQTALHEMRLRGEPENICRAFAVLGTESGAQIALRALCGD